MKQIVIIRDAKAEMFMNPVFSVAVGEAIRSFEDEVNNPQSPLNKHPEDYTLFHLGTFDEATGKFDLFEAPVSLGGASDYIKK